MKTELYIKNMVCDRCKTTVERLLRKHGAKIIAVQLGKVAFEAPEEFELELFDRELTANGFELIKNPEVKLVEDLKISLLELLNQSNPDKNLSVYLSKRLGKEYSGMSKIFKKIEGYTLEKYFIRLKIEKAKELIQMQELSFSEIAYQLGYSSISHLSGQFKSLTGMTMSDYQKNRDWDRSPLDRIL